MRFRTLEIRWHDSRPISTCDFQPTPRKQTSLPRGTTSYRLATGGEDNCVRMWMVHPHLRPSEDQHQPANGPRPPRVEYLATLNRHSAAVNVVRFSPNGESLASAGDDGMIIIWSPSLTQAHGYGSELSAEELAQEKEYWKPRVVIRCSSMQVYDLAWSPTGEYILAGSTDNTARIFSAVDGKPLHELADHTHFVQGVAWDPLGDYIATQSSDRSVHVSRVTPCGKNGLFEVHAVGKNTRMPYHRHHHSHSHSSFNPRPPSRTPSVSSTTSRRPFPAESDTESVVGLDDPPLTPISTSAPLFAPPPDVSSRRSSFSSAAGPGPASSPSTFASVGGRYGRSPSPMPPLPAIRAAPSNGGSTPASWAQVKLYGDEAYTNFFRRLTFSPDGALLLTPAGQFEDPAVDVGSSMWATSDKGESARGRKGRRGGEDAVETTATAQETNSGGGSSVYIYSRANFARPPIAQLPGHKKASVAVRFSPVLLELRAGVADGKLGTTTTATAALEAGMEGSLDVDLNAPLPLMDVDNAPPTPAASVPSTPKSIAHSRSQSTTSAAAGATNTGGGSVITPSTNTGSLFALPYRMLYAVATMDTIAIYDTQQAGPVALLTKLHYDEFTDMSWSPDGQTLMLSSRDGYCTLVMFDEVLAPYHTQQHAMQIQSIAMHSGVPLIPASGSASQQGPSSATSGSPMKQSAVVGSNSAAASMQRAPSSGGPGGASTITQLVPRKREPPPLTPEASADTDAPASTSASASAASKGMGEEQQRVNEKAGKEEGEKRNAEEEEKEKEPPKKKRRVALVRVGDLD